VLRGRRRANRRRAGRRRATPAAPLRRGRARRAAAAAAAGAAAVAWQTRRRRHARRGGKGGASAAAACGGGGARRRQGRRVGRGCGGGVRVLRARILGGVAVTIHSEFGRWASHLQIYISLRKQEPRGVVGVHVRQLPVQRHQAVPALLPPPIAKHRAQLKGRRKKLRPVRPPT